MKDCANCGVSLADDQRYCLECGTRQLQARSQFLERFTPAAVGPNVPSAPAAGSGRSTNVTALAGIGVLLLAMGVGVLIGRASGSTSAGPPQVISVGAPAAATGVAGTGAESSGAGTTSGSSEIPEDWPAGKSGYTVRLQTFSASTAQASEVATAKSSALGKGATGVGVLLSSNFSSLPADQYMIYSGDYSSEAQA
ncbi:MAG TPA: zinc ribbon domain-containing protein, partial [Solirubrobacteraceae bacterium]